MSNVCSSSSCTSGRILAFISSLLYLYPALVASTTISRSLLKSTRIITLSPSNKALIRQYRAPVTVAVEAASEKEKQQRLSGYCDEEVMDSPEFLYIPSLLTLDASSIECQREDVTDDDHCVSLLCDRGFTVHSLDFLGPIEGRQWMLRDSERVKPFSFNSIVQAIDEAVQWHHHRSRSSQGGKLSISQSHHSSSLHLITKEVSVLHVLHYLSEVAMPRSRVGDHIKGVVLLDPPPMQAIGTEEGRLRVLKRYVLPLTASSSSSSSSSSTSSSSSSSSSYKEGEHCDPVRRRHAVDRRLAVEDAKHSLLLLQYRNYLDNMGELGAYLVGLSVELFRRPESARSALDIITEDAQVLLQREIDQFYQQLDSSSMDSNNNRLDIPSDRLSAAAGNRKRRKLQPLFARDTAVFSPTTATPGENNSPHHRSAGAAIAIAVKESSQYYYDPTTSSTPSSSKTLLGSQCPRQCVQLARSLHPQRGGGGGVLVVNSAFRDRRGGRVHGHHTTTDIDMTLTALMGRDHRRDEDDDAADDSDGAVDAADEWGLESMQELARLYHQVGEGTPMAGGGSNFVDLVGRTGGAGADTDRSDDDADAAVSRAIADTVLTRTILRYLYS